MLGKLGVEGMYAFDDEHRVVVDAQLAVGERPSPKFCRSLLLMLR